MTTNSTNMATIWSDFMARWRRPRTFAIIMGGSTLVLFVLGCLAYKSSHGFRYNVLYPNFGRGQISQLTTPTSPTKHQVLLITYGRSGSTFTSALINHNKDVFFTFEPLYVVKMRSLLNQTSSRENISRAFWLNDNFKDSLAIVNAFLTCNFPQEYIYALDNMQHRNSDATKNLYECLRVKKTGIPHVSCYMKFIQACEDHKIRFVKTIRFPVAWAEWFLESNPNLKLLYLMRDPRATLYSQARVFRQFAWQEEIDHISKLFCELVDSDLDAAERLKKKYPDRVMGIRYEHGALEPFDFTKAIYNFLGLKYNEDIENFVYDLTNHNSTDKRTKEDYDVVRANSSVTMNSWRNTAGFNNVRKVDKNCAHFYRKLGYERVKSQTDLESQRPLVRAPDPGSIFS